MHIGDVGRVALDAMGDIMASIHKGLGVTSYQGDRLASLPESGSVEATRLIYQSSQDFILTGATTLSRPTSQTNYAHIYIQQGAALIARLDGQFPTPSEGILIKDQMILESAAEIDNIKIIPQAGTPSVRIDFWEQTPQADSTPLIAASLAIGGAQIQLAPPAGAKKALLGIWDAPVRWAIAGSANDGYLLGVGGLLLLDSVAEIAALKLISNSVTSRGFVQFFN